PELDAIAWYGGNSGGQTHPVRRKAPNPYGLHDMLGNVYEWCQDAAERIGEPYTYQYATAQDPEPPTLGSFRVVRGGAWDSLAGRVRAAFRYASPRGVRGVYLGFRLAGGQESAPRKQAGEPR